MDYQKGFSRKKIAHRVMLSWAVVAVVAFFAGMIIGCAVGVHF